MLCKTAGWPETKRGEAQMDLSAMSPYIRVAYGYRVPSNWVLRERVIFDYELLYIKEGFATVTVEGVEYSCQQGDFLLIKPRQSHIIHSGGEDSYHLHVHFDMFYQEDSPDIKICYHPLDQISELEQGWFREDLFSGKICDVPTLIRLSNPTYVEKMLIDIINEFEQKPIYYQENCKGLFTQLWIYILRELHWNDKPHITSHFEVLDQVKNFIRINSNLDISVEEMAKMANFSKSHFIHLFKASYGITPSRYRLLMQIEKAKKLIQFSNKSITEIAEICGFQSIHVFSSTFKKIDGVSPSYYRHSMPHPE